MQYACNTGVGEYSTGVRWNDYNEISQLSIRCILHLISSESHFGHCASGTLLPLPNLPLLLVSIVILCDAGPFPAPS